MRVVEQELQRRLPQSWKADLTLAPRVGPGVADAILRIEAPDGSRAALVVEAKVSMEPREARSAADQAALNTVDLDPGDAAKAPPLVAARFLSRRARALLRERGVNYADATGNWRLALDRPALFIETEGAERDPAPDDRQQRSLRGPVAARVVRALWSMEPPIKIIELAKQARTSPPTASRIVDLLRREGIVQPARRGPVLSVDRRALIERWSEDYAFADQNEVWLYLEPRRLERLFERLRAAPFRYAVTGSFAARLISEYAEAKLAMVYVDDPEQAASELRLTRVEDGGNVMLARPYDDVVFDETRVEDGITYAAPSQVAADLLRAPGRGPAEGADLLRALTEEAGA